MLQLFVEKPDGVTPNAAVRWCLSHDVSVRLGDKYKQAFVFISVTREDGTEARRFLFPVEQMLGWVQFNRAGRHTLHAAVIGLSSDSIEARDELKRNAFRKDSRSSWSCEVFREEVPATFLPERLINLFLHGSVDVLARTELDVVVADGLFAKEPSAWLKSYVEQYFDSPSFDECQFKQRLIAAFSILPLCYAVVAVICWAIKLVQITVLLFWGERGIKWEAVFKPFESPGEVWSSKHRRNFFAKQADGTPRSKWFRLFHPLSVIAFTGAGFVVNRFGVGQETGLGIAGLAVLTFLVWATVTLVEKMAPEVHKSRFQRQEEKTRHLEAVERERQLREQRESQAVYEALVCTGTPLRPEVDALPKERRTFYLRVLAHKAEVCRPFAK